MLPTSTLSLLTPVRLLAMDVDGVLTDGRITYSAGAVTGDVELKNFCVRDGLGIGLVHSAGLAVAWITGRESRIVARRAAELGIDELAQRARNKRVVLQAIAERRSLPREAILYLGDDLNDLPAFDAAGVCVAVADAAGPVRERAHWVTDAPGGRGAVREVAETVLRAQGRWEAAVETFLARLEQEQQRLDGGASNAPSPA